jgi:hypothetical protein
MRRNHRWTAGAAVGALLAAPALGLLSGAVANADTGDDLVSLGPYAIGGFNDTFTYDSSTLAFDNYTTGSLGGSLPFDFDVYQGPEGSNSAEYVFTIPLLFQSGFNDVDGTVTPFYSFDAFNFLTPDAGLATLGGTPDTTGIVTIPLTFDGYTDTLSATASGAFDNYLQGALGPETFDLDIFSGVPGTDSGEVVFTIPSLLQIGFDDVGGVITPIDTFAPFDAINPDIGLVDLAATLLTGAT